ncbi:lipopolysaccharide biosynthesis protein [Geobacter benzoatilyticus]|uniref:Polysaccharide biosynthesis C-terminal domain-containing protein n=1 Tax=Geobacter benzoatilyticus TaxID=2815309 RepID=A0ABX7Q1U1_9BACT|nr:oligosaccharide flippase family protein [Geobacter benzoatilyticus]QSV45040.1 polysaccharide biosynthesis C-terminal domain-containing protein [Geobacter benzoatilyticus]
MSRKLIFNSLSGTALYGANIIVAFVMSPIIIRALGNRDYGLWELVMSVIGYMGLLDLGIGPALVRFVSVADGKQDKDDLQKTISTSFVFFVVVGVVAVFSFLLLGYYPAIIAGKETKAIANLGSVFMLLGLNAGMLFPLQVFIATLMGVQRHYFINNVRIVLMVVRAILSYYLLTSYPGKGLLIMALLEPVFTAIQVVAFIGAVYVDRSIPKIAFAAVSLTKAKEMMSFGAKSATMLVASRIQNQSVPLIIGNVINLSSIIYFVIPNRLVEYAKGLSLSLGIPLTPYFGSQLAGGDTESLRKNWIASALILQMITLSMPIALVFLGNEFLELWIGKDIAIQGNNILIILILSLIMQSLVPNAFGLLAAYNSHGRSALVWLISAIFSVIAAMFVGYHYGINAIVAASVLPSSVCSFINLKYACDKINISMAHYFRETSAKIIVPLIAFSIALYVSNIVLIHKSYGSLLIKLLISTAVYMIMLWIKALSSEQKHIVKDVITIKVQRCFYDR